MVFRVMLLLGFVRGSFQRFVMLNLVFGFFGMFITIFFNGLGGCGLVVNLGGVLNIVSMFNSHRVGTIIIFVSFRRFGWGFITIIVNGKGSVQLMIFVFTRLHTLLWWMDVLWCIAHRSSVRVLYDGGTRGGVGVLGGAVSGHWGPYCCMSRLGSN